MATLYLRNVPEPVMDRLKRLAEQEGMSVSAFAVRELTESTKRVDNAALLADLPHVPVSTEAILEALGKGRWEQ